MKIVKGVTSPAKLVTSDGTVIASGTYTHCGQVLDALDKEYGNAHAEAEELKGRLAARSQYAGPSASCDARPFIKQKDSK